MINYSKFDQKRFLTGKPFPNIVIDDLFDTDFLNDIQNDYPGIDDISWWKYNNHFEKKLAFNDVKTLSKSIQDFFTIVNSWKFVKNLEILTGIPDLISDPSLHGGGLHRIEKGGKLDIHADFNYHKVTGWRRRLNMITFLNKEWKESYGGSIEFWNQDMSECVTKIPPFFNRTVIFMVDDDTWHGHPDPLSCPDSMVRRSLATYYYTLHDKNLDNLDYRSTDYQKRPSDSTNKNIEKMRTKRRFGRLEDLKT
jgi:hypothetical protein